MKVTLKLIALVLFITLTGVGCISFSGKSRQADGGVFKTVDQGEHWVVKKVFLTAEGIKSISGENIVALTVDPQDHLALYAGTTDSGLFYTYDGGDSWFQARQLSGGRVNAVSVDAKNKCTIYVASGQRIWKSVDCSRSFTPIYFEARSNVTMTQITADWFNTRVLYAGTSEGDVLKSADGGANWASVHRLEDRVVSIYIDPFDSRIVYIGLKDDGLWKTTDAGGTWVELSDALKDFGRGRGLVSIVGDAVTRDLLMIANKYGILRSTDGGVSWQALNLPTPPESVTIHSLAVNPRNGNEIYYGTASTFYRSTNGGANWTTKKLPTSRAATMLLVDFQDSNVLYLGTTLIKR
ncbi:hypothetical protein HY478_02500 [Candidatus Uhrbacteria bacterium]|nr:hypothetical protein [Candidatus Uhrbacteria bacterium]